tara:strand:- start:2278 stop:2442 length:165 start_codon:yes stop_codon:yes gene_type:complete
MTEFIYHALGICGEHWHPNLINVSVIGMAVWCVAKVVRSAVRARYARFEENIRG